MIAIENARLFEELEQRNRDLAEALEQQTATAEVLRVIASSPTQLQDVLDTLVATATRLCGAEHAVVQVPDGGELRVVANLFASDEVARHWADRHALELLERRPPLPIMLAPERIAGRAALERRTIYVANLAETTEFPESRSTIFEIMGVHSQVTAPLIRGDELIGVFTLHARRKDAFSPSQVAQLETFADQAVIAIENARLFQELEQRTTDLSRALEQQTALGEVLRVIATSPTDLESVLQSIIDTAARLCKAPGGTILQLREADGRLSPRVAYGRHHDLLAGLYSNPFTEFPGLPVSPGMPPGRALLERRTIHVHDIVEVIETEYPDARQFQPTYGFRTIVSLPLVANDLPIGIFAMFRYEVQPFTDAEIGLLETFADQAVIAIENARLFEALQGRVRELQALGEVGHTVSSSLDINEVLSTIIANATHLAGADGGSLYEYDEATQTLAPSGPLPTLVPEDLDEELTRSIRGGRIRLGDGAVGRAVASRGPVEIPDILEPGSYSGPIRDWMN